MLLDADGRPVSTAGAAARERNPEASLHPWLSAASIVSLGYPPEHRLSASGVRSRKARVLEDLAAFEAEGLVVFEAHPDGRHGSSHRGARAVERLQQRYPNLALVHGPVHASWLNQIEIYFSIVQRKVLTPNDFNSLAEVEHRLLAFQRHYESLARPFTWTFTRRDLARLLATLALQTSHSIAA